MTQLRKERDKTIEDMGGSRRERGRKRNVKLVTEKHKGNWWYTRFSSKSKRSQNGIRKHDTGGDNCKCK